jgi:hypothetical protein
MLHPTNFKLLGIPSLIPSFITPSFSFVSLLQQTQVQTPTPMPTPTQAKAQQITRLSTSTFTAMPWNFGNCHVLTMLLLLT